MIKTDELEKFQDNNKDFGIVGVIRTLYPKIEIKVLLDLTAKDDTYEVV
jgi:hypothetical protein